MDIQTALGRMATGSHLGQEEARAVMHQIMSGGATPAQIGAYLMALRLLGETVDEIAGAAQAMREHATRVEVPAGATVIDTCGTGGDGRGTFNISTTVAFVVAGCGVTVAKHGNRSISSKCGSADLLRELGVNVGVEPPVVERCLHEAGIGFLFAPRHHGAMRHAAAPRQELGLRTMFNLLGPLTNPAGAPFQLLGVFDGKWTEPLARVLGRLGSRRALVVHGSDGLDEITTTGVTFTSELQPNGTVINSIIDPEQLGLPRAEPEALAGGDAVENAAITRAILEGEPGARRDIVVLNAAAALQVAGVVPELAAGMEAARAALDDGRARERLARLVAVSNG